MESIGGEKHAITKPPRQLTEIWAKPPFSSISLFSCRFLPRPSPHPFCRFSFFPPIPRAVPMAQLPPSKSKHLCDACGQPAFLQCTGCKLVHYCNVICQKGHWKAHRAACKAVQAKEAEDVDELTAKMGGVAISKGAKANGKKRAGGGAAAAVAEDGDVDELTAKMGGVAISKGAKPKAKAKGRGGGGAAEEEQNEPTPTKPAPRPLLQPPAKKNTNPKKKKGKRAKPKPKASYAGPLPAPRAPAKATYDPTGLCAICMCPKQDPVRAKGCGHTYCRVCIDELKRRDIPQVCPECRGPLPETMGAEELCDEGYRLYHAVEQAVKRGLCPFESLSEDMVSRVEEAEVYWRAAADMGDAMASCNLGTLLLDARKDYDGAMEWMSQLDRSTVALGCGQG